MLNKQKQPSRGVLGKRCSKNMQQIYRENPCRSVISIKFQNNFIDITLRCGCSHVNLLRIFRTPFTKNTSERLLLNEYVEWVRKRQYACFLNILLSQFIQLENMAKAFNLALTLCRYTFKMVFKTWLNQYLSLLATNSFSQLLLVNWR